MAIDQGKVAKLQRDLGKIPPELRKTLRRELKKAAKPVVADAKSRASWSNRIPAAIKLQTRLSGRDAGLTIRVNAKKAPHGRPYENMGQQGTFRHPVYGNRHVWVSQTARPFLFPAADAHRSEVRAAAGDAVDSAARQHGFR